MEGREREGPKLLLNQGPSEPCYATASQVTTHLDNHDILVDCQHGLRRKRSCETQLLITSHDLAEIPNNHSQADVAALDFSKAFDKVPHYRLLLKLKYYNLNSHVIVWVESLLRAGFSKHGLGLTTRLTPGISIVNSRRVFPRQNPRINYLVNSTRLTRELKITSG